MEHPSGLVGTNHPDRVASLTGISTQLDKRLSVAQKVVDLASKTDSFAEEIAKQPELQDLVRQNLPAKGAVLAFNCDSCPEGWKPFSEANGRVVIGVGSGPGLTKRERLDEGGTEKITLRKSEIPTHNIEYILEYYDNDNNRKYGTTSGNRADLVRIRKTADSYDEASTQAHDNMPPFITLLYCEKL